MARVKCRQYRQPHSMVMHMNHITDMTSIPWNSAPGFLLYIFFAVALFRILDYGISRCSLGV